MISDIGKAARLLLASAALLFPGAALASEPADLTELSLQDLLKIQVTSASRRSEALSDTAAAVYVITAQDIKASPATNLPELLRNVPGMHVAPINANAWAVSARDFNGRFANKLLVMIDGRSIYTPLFSGVLWDRHDLPLEDIERIEIIRGPGASVWGVNAVNGIINIITKSASQTLGSYAQGVLGDDQRIVTLRQGGKVGKDAALRAFLKYRGMDDQEALTGLDANDGFTTYHTGLRFDWQPHPDHSLQFQGGYYHGALGDTITVPTFTPPYFATQDAETGADDAFVSTLWEYKISASSSLATRVSYQHSTLDDPRLHEKRQTVDVDVQHTYGFTPTETLVWGFGGRYTSDTVKDTSLIEFVPASQSTQFLNVFAQITSELIDHRLLLTVGSKLEYNDYTQLELQPTARALWRLNAQHKVWAAISRAARVPSRAEDSIVATAAVMPGPFGPFGPPTEIRYQAHGNLNAESVVTGEVGYRGNLAENFTLDATLFHSKYTDLIATVPGMPFFDPGPPALFVAPLDVANASEARAWGAELVADWKPTSNVRLELIYSFIDVDLRPTTAAAIVATEQTSPQHQIALRSQWQITDALLLNVTTRHQTSMPVSGIDSFTGLDATLKWRLDDSLDVTLAGLNLIEEPHLEFAPEIIFAGSPTLVSRSAYVALTWRR